MSENEYFKYKTGFTGGTEIMAKLFHDLVGSYLPLAEKYNCIVLPGLINLPSYESLLTEDKDIVLWLHNNPNEFLPPVNLPFFQREDFHKKLAKVIVVSRYAQKILTEQSGIPEEKIEVVHNAIAEIPVDLGKFETIEEPRLIYISQPERGLSIALRTLHGRSERFRFDIYCDVSSEFLASLPENVTKDDRFNFHGRRPREEVLEALAGAHIFVYPSTWYETFCVSLVEALASGCIAVYNSIGSLPEIGMGHGLTYLQTDLSDEVSHHEKLDVTLTDAFDLLTSRLFNPANQIDAVLARYSHEAFIISWFKVASNLLGKSSN
jgi:glycosyltransferase involved in cell wall biosynthesis